MDNLPLELIIERIKMFNELPQKGLIKSFDDIKAGNTVVISKYEAISRSFADTWFLQKEHIMNILKEKKLTLFITVDEHGNEFLKFKQSKLS